MKAIALLSGGIDSATCAAIARGQGFDVYALTFDYGQRNRWEVAAAAKLAANLGANEHLVLPLPLRAFGGSSLTSDLEVPTCHEAPGIPSTYVPARNTIFLSFAVVWAESLRARGIFIGANALDAPGYPDCRPEYLAAFEAMARLAALAPHMTIEAPLIAMTKADIVRTAIRLGVDLGSTTSCYSPGVDGDACDLCSACVQRADAFSSIEQNDRKEAATHE